MLLPISQGSDEVELDECESVLTVIRWWISKQATTMFGACYLKQEIKMIDISLWILPVLVDSSTNQRLKPETCESTTSPPKTFTMLQTILCILLLSVSYSHHTITWVNQSSHIQTLPFLAYPTHYQWAVLIQHTADNGLSLFKITHGLLTAHRIIVKWYQVTRAVFWIWSLFTSLSLFPFNCILWQFLTE